EDVAPAPSAEVTVRGRTRRTRIGLRAPSSIDALLAVRVFERVRKSESTDLSSKPGAALVGRSEMNSRIDAGINHFANAVAERGPLAHEAWIGRTRRRKRHARVIVKEQPEHGSHGAADGRMRGDVLGEVRRGDERRP